MSNRSEVQGAEMPKKTFRRRLARHLRRRHWYTGWRKRVVDIVDYRHPWWDWAHAVMILFGDDDGGNWSEPSPPTWYYRIGDGKRMRFTGYPTHPVSTIEVIKDYSAFIERTEGLNDDEMYEWKAICVNQDGDLQLGKQYWGEGFHGLSRWETRLLGKYLRQWRHKDWWGVRSWLYMLGLHYAVHRRKPFTCQVTPDKRSGGYNHWYCQLQRRHSGPHRFRNYVWPGPGTLVEYRPPAEGVR